MLDRDLAELYGVENKRLGEQVKRNVSKFPSDFMFQLSKKETEDLRSQFATANLSTKSRVLPTVFTEHGVLMLANVLNSEKANHGKHSYHQNLHKDERDDSYTERHSVKN